MFRILCLSLVLVHLAWPARAAEKNFDFIETKVGEAPAGFRSLLSGTGTPGEWRVVVDDVPSSFAPLLTETAPTTKRPVLAQLSRDRTDERFPLLVYDGDTYGDFTFSTKFKLVAGDEEQMAGLAFRIQDEKNYYYVRASGLGNTIYFYKIVDGERSAAPIGNKIPVTKGVWHELAVECKGNQIHTFFDGKEAIVPLGDKSFAAGKVGFWTKSDSLTYFAEPRIVFTPRETLAQVLVRDALRKYPRLQGLKIFAVTSNQVAQVIASDDAGEVGQAAQKEAETTLSRGTIYFGKGEKTISVTMPVRDSNGDMAAAARVIMKPFFGQTEKNAIARALPIVKEMEARIRSAQELQQ